MVLVAHVPKNLSSTTKHFHWLQCRSRGLFQQLRLLQPLVALLVVLLEVQLNYELVHLNEKVGCTNTSLEACFLI